MGTKTIPFLTIIFLLFNLTVAFAEESEEEVPAGMEVIHSGSVRLIVPKGAKVEQKGGVVVVENIAEYTARRLMELEGRLEVLEKDEDQLKEELQLLKQELKQRKSQEEAPQD